MKLKWGRNEAELARSSSTCTRWSTMEKIGTNSIYNMTCLMFRLYYTSICLVETHFLVLLPNI